MIEKLSADEAAFRTDVARAVEGLLATPLDQILEIDRVEGTLAAALSKEQVEHGTRPISRAIHLAVLHAARSETAKLGAFVPPKARERIERLLDKKQKLNEKILRQLIEQEAMEETLRDVIFDALKEFNERVNPFVADWGLPALLKKLGPFGFSPVAKSLDNVRVEFDRRLEPEMRKFLQGFSRRAVRRMADLVVQNNDDAKFIALRKGLVAWLYEQEIRELVGNVDDESAELWNGVGVDVAEHALLLEASKERRREALEGLLRDHGKESLGKVLALHGFTAKPDADAIANSLWPIARAIFRGPAAEARVAAIVDEFWQQVESEAK